MATAARKRTVNRIEEAEQARLVKWSHRREVRDLMPDLRWLHHSPNGGRRDGFTGAQMKALGVKPGFPDLVLPAMERFGDAIGLVIEMKKATGRASSEQQEWMDHFKAQGWMAVICRSAEEAREQLCRYLGIEPFRAPPLE